MGETNGANVATNDAAAAAANGSEVKAAKGKKAFSRLPATVKPCHYVVKLKPDLKKFTFTGSLEVSLDVTSATDEIVFNAAELKISEVTVNGEAAVSVTLDDDLERVVVKVAQPLEVNSKAVLKCNFVGELNDKMRGFYRSKYTEQGEDRYAAVTQFESTDARRCFPCWDEPAIKATFDLVVSGPKNHTVLSNMPVKSEAEDPETPDYKVVSFDTTPLVSTYLIAIVVGEYEHVEGVSEEGIKVRVYTPLAKKEQGEFALDASIKAITYYKDFFGISYPLKKYDCIAISDFQCGAMENWGLVTFRETAVLVDPENTSAGTKQWVAIVVTHEMAHQWFGNLVTMEWWTHLWLNEGFASFMENTCTNDLYPEFGIWTQFVSGTLISALELDALKNSHPIEVEVGHPSEVDEIFDNISYNKGASVIRMLHDFIGREAFKSGMKAYLTKFSYKNAETPDLWRSLGEASGKPIDAIMSTWTSQMGFPLITASKLEDGKTIKLSQEKFNADGSTDAPTKSFQWKVPVKILTSSGKVHEVLLEDKSTTVTLDDVDLNATGSWYKVNAGFVGYYRVKYENPEDLLQLRPAIEEKTLSEVDRLGLMDDLFALVQAGKTDTVSALKLMEAFKANEDSYVVWSSIDNCLSKLKTILCDTPHFESHFKPYMLDLMSNILSKVGWEKQPGEHHTQVLLRSLVLTRMGCLGHTETVEEATRRFQDHVNGTGSQVPADLRACVFRIVASSGGVKAMDQLMDLFRKVELQEEKDRIARAMGATQEPEMLKRVLDFAIGSEVRSQDSPFVISGVAFNHKGRDLAWDFVKSNYSMLTERYKQGMLFTRLVQFTTESFTTVEKAEEITQFFIDNYNPAERTIRQCIENINLNAAWIQRDGDNLQKYFTSK